MNDFVSTLEKRASDSLKSIREEEVQILLQAKRAMRVFEPLFHELRTFAINYEFENEEAEIQFFKEIKPRLFWQLIYYQKIYQLELDRPTGGKDVQIEYLKRELEHIRYYFSKNKEFYHYYRDGADYLDSKYFLRGRAEIMYNSESYYLYNDPLFSTIGEYKVSEVISNDMVETYLTEELNRLDSNGRERTYSGLSWTANKTDLIERLYGEYLLQVVNGGKVTLKEMQRDMEQHYNIELGNISRVLYDMSIRKNPTQFLDKMKDALANYLQTLNEK